MRVKNCIICLEKFTPPPNADTADLRSLCVECRKVTKALSERVTANRLANKEVD